MLAATAGAVVALPVLVPALVVADTLRRRWRLPSVRVYLFVTQYALNDSAEILLAPIMWVMAGFGTRIGTPASQRRHERLQAWSISVLASRAERLLGLRIELDTDGAAALEPGPVIVLCRHVNVFDASLPAVLYQRLGYRVRGVIMTELLADPGVDLVYRRTGSVFVARDDDPDARSQVARLGEGSDARTALVIFPEGRVFRPERRERSFARLTERDPDRARRLKGITHVLPPRPGGVLALLDAVPEADVVVIAHTGLDAYPTFRELARAVPLVRPVRVTAWRVPAAEVPTDRELRTGWLDDQWRRVDEWVDAHAPSK
jgi:1-acyl-sn-glycerol-3-phosphate acyltransferase